MALYLISCSDIFDAMFASKAGAGDTIIQQGMWNCVYSELPFNPLQLASLLLKSLGKSDCYREVAWLYSQSVCSGCTVASCELLNCSKVVG